MAGLQQGFTAFGMGSAINLHCKNPQHPMSLMGQSRRSSFAGRMSVLTPIATEIAICVHVG
jgi:hypothetical protein